MELRSFISQTLKAVIDGVQDAQQKLPAGTVIPAVKRTFEAVQHGVSEIQGIDFEVSVRAEEQAGSEAKFSIVAIVGGGLKGESAKTVGHTATLRFRVPVRLPCGKETETHR